GRVNFGLPNLQGRAPIHMGSGHTLGERGGEQAHTLSIAELPTHTHVAMASPTNGDQAVPNNNYLGPGSNLEYVPDPCNFSLQHLMCLSQRGVSGLTVPAASPYQARSAQTV